MKTMLRGAAALALSCAALTLAGPHADAAPAHESGDGSLVSKCWVTHSCDNGVG